MAVKVRKKDENSSVTDMSLLIETSDRYVDWDHDELVSSIASETGVRLEVASETATGVRERIQELADKMGWTYISTGLIREIVEQELLSKGRRYKNRAKKYRTLGLSENEITKVIENEGARDNGNLGHNPDAVLFTSAETMMKQYALKHVFPSDVVESHLAGDISLHDLGAVFKVYAFSKGTKVNVKIEGEEWAGSLSELWERIEVPELVVDNQCVKELPDGIEIKDRGRWVGLERLIQHNEKKEMRSFVLDDGTLVSVTSDHACLIKRGERLLLVRADEVEKSDKFLRVHDCD